MSHTSKNASQNNIELTHQESHCEFKNTPLKLQSRNQEAAGWRRCCSFHPATGKQPPKVTMCRLSSGQTCGRSSPSTSRPRPTTLLVSSPSYPFVVGLPRELSPHPRAWVSQSHQDLGVSQTHYIFPPQIRPPS
ncbi:hypothetical protein CapIbe_001722 [Capra ibex]